MNDVEVAIVGAGPYGLSLASHLRAAGVSFRQFGQLMNPWRTAMPQGMFLKSQGFASNLSDPRGTHTLEAFCAATGRPYASYGLPVPLDTFVAYGQWFQAELLPDLEQTLVTGISRRDAGYRLELATGETVSARQVVVAAGIEHFPFVPVELAGLPEEIFSHSSRHTDLAACRGRSVIVLGAASPRWSRRRCCTSRGRLSGSSCVRRRWPGTAPRSTLSAHCSGGCANQRPASARAGGHGSTPTTLASSGTCQPPPASAGPGRRSGWPGRAGSAAGWKASSRSSPG